MRSEDWVYKISRMNGKRIPLFAYLNIPKGWIVTADVPQIFWEKCKLNAYPMKAINILGLFNNIALNQWKVCTEHLGTSIMMVMIPDDESEEGYNAGPILLDDLQAGPNELLQDSLKYVGNNGLLSEAKRRCAMLMLGWRDTK